jgi:hypothetical protein
MPYNEIPYSLKDTQMDENETSENTPRTTSAKIKTGAEIVVLTYSVGVAAIGLYGLGRDGVKAFKEKRQAKKAQTEKN